MSEEVSGSIENGNFSSYNMLKYRYFRKIMEI
jgi:hypothetical protein